MIKLKIIMKMNGCVNMNKIMDPNAFKDMFLSAVKAEKTGKICSLFIPDFFADTDGELKLSFVYVDGVYYVHDNGCAVRRLKANCKSEPYKEKLKKVYSDRTGDEKVVGSFTQVFHFFYYIQALIFISNADLIADSVKDKFYFLDPEVNFPDAESVDDVDVTMLFEKLQEGITVGSKNHDAVWMSVRTCYSLNSTTVGYLVERFENGTFRISDKCKGNIEGEVFESFYWGNNDIYRYSDYINRYCKRFGGDFDGKDISVTALSEKDIVRSLFRFVNLAVLLSEFGRLIKLPEPDANQ